MHTVNNFVQFPSKLYPTLALGTPHFNHTLDKMSTKLPAWNYALISANKQNIKRKYCAKTRTDKKPPVANAFKKGTDNLKQISRTNEKRKKPPVANAL